MSGDYTISYNLLLSHSEVRSLVDHKAVDFYESAGVNKGIDPFSCGHLSPRMLRLYLLGSAAELSLLSLLLELIEPLRHAHWFEECEADSLYKSRDGSSRREESASLRSLSEFCDRRSRSKDYPLRLSLD